MRRLQTVGRRRIAPFTRSSTTRTRSISRPAYPLTKGPITSSLGNISNYAGDAASQTDEGVEMITPKPKTRSRVPMASSLGNIEIPGNYRILPAPAPSKRFRPDITWVSQEMGAHVNLSFAQKQAAKRMEDLESVNEPISPAFEEVFNAAPTPASNAGKMRQYPRGAISSSKQEDLMSNEQMTEAGRAENLKRTEMYEARRKEREIAAEERRQTARDKLDQEREYKAKAWQEIQKEKSEQASRPSPRREREARDEAAAEEERKGLGLTDSPVYVEMPEIQYLSTPRPLPQTVKEQIEAIQAAHAVSKPDSDSNSTTASSSKSTKSKATVDALVAARVQVLKGRAGDYSRYLAPHLGVDHTSGMVGPTAYAQLILSRRPGVGLGKRRQAIQVVEKFVGMSEVRAAT